MLKLKTKRSAAKRFKRVGLQKYRFKYKKSYLRHYLVKKSSKRKRHLRGLKFISVVNVATLKVMLPYK